MGKWANSMGSSLFIWGDLGRGVSLSIWSSIAFMPGLWFSLYGRLLLLLLLKPPTGTKIQNQKMPIFLSQVGQSQSNLTLGSVEVWRFGRPVIRINRFSQIAHRRLFRQVTVRVQPRNVLWWGRTPFSVVTQDQSRTKRSGWRELQYNPVGYVNDDIGQSTKLARNQQQQKLRGTE